MLRSTSPVKNTARRPAGVQLEMRAVAIREVESIKQLEALRHDWIALWKSSSIATPFQSPDWLIRWWKHFGAGADRLCVLVLRHEERLIAIAPLFVNSEDEGSLRLLGSGNTDYLDILCNDHAGRESAAVIDRSPDHCLVIRLFIGLYTANV